MARHRVPSVPGCDGVPNAEGHRGAVEAIALGVVELPLRQAALQEPAARESVFVPEPGAIA